MGLPLQISLFQGLLFCLLLKASNPIIHIFCPIIWLSVVDYDVMVLSSILLYFNMVLNKEISTLIIHACE